MNVDGDLIDWSEISSNDWEAILLGNGFSINIWEKFKYESLYDLSKNGKYEGEKLSERAVGLFEFLGSNNFEEILKILYHAQIVDMQLGYPQKDEINRLYKNTKQSLASAVNFTHVPSNEINFDVINRGLSEYRNVFTTNYDLILYWSILDDVYRGRSRFRDYFWNDDCRFDLSDTEVYSGSIAIHYLHGAIHLVECSDGVTKKLSVASDKNLAEFFSLDHPERFPLFVSESSSEKKMLKIKQNEYLRFCYRNLKKVKSGLVVLGHSLNKEYDRHIIDAISSSQASCVAIGVWPHQREEDIVSYKARILKDFGKEVSFYNSESHPLGSTELRVGS